MRIFAVRGRSSSGDGPEASASLPTGPRLGLPHRCEAVGEALASGSSALEAAMFAGRQLARDGASLDEALDRLHQTWQQVLGTDPTFEATRSLATGWTDTSLVFMHQMTCEDPLTGLASQAHLRTRIQDVIRSMTAAEVPAAYALVVCEIAWSDPSGAGIDQLTRSMRLSQVGEHVRTVFGRTEPIARLGAFRVAVLARRDDRLGRRVRLLRHLLAGLDAQSTDPRVWLEGVPVSEHTASILLDELARS